MTQRKMTGTQTHGLCQMVPIQIDTNAQVNLISMTEISAMKGKPKIIKKRVPLKDYNGKDIKSRGQRRVKLIVKNKD